MLRNKLFFILIFVFLYTFSVGQTAIDSLLKEWDKIEYINDNEGKIALLHQITKQHSNNPDSAIYYARKTLSLLTGDNIEDRYIVHIRLSKAYYMLGNSSYSFEHAQKAVEFAKKSNNIKGIANGYNSIGLVHMLQENYEESIIDFQKSLRLSIGIGDSITITKSHFNLSIVYDDLNKYDSALIEVNKSIAISSSGSKDIYHLAMAYNRKGYILTNLGNYSEAITNHFKAIEVMDVDNTWELCFAYSGLGLAYNGLNNFEKSINYGIKSFELAKEINAKWDIQNSAKIVSDSYIDAGDYENGYKYYTIYKIYNDSIFNESNQKKISTLELRQANLEKNVLEEENKYHKEVLSTRNYQLLISLILIISFLVIIIILIRNNAIRKKYIAKINLQKMELEKLNSSKDKILSVLAHDMRGPMNSILGLLYVIKHKVSGDEFILQKHFDEIYERTTTVTSTLNSLLSWSINQFTGVKANPHKELIYNVVDEQINLCSYDSDKKSIEIIHKKLSKDVFAFVDVEHLRIVIRNLLTNAIKFTKSGGLIIFSYEIQNDNVIINVSDNGVGMDSKVLNNIFSSTGKTSPGTIDEIGTGLGLALCKEYVENNGGKLEVSSSKGEGSTFKVFLKRA